MIMLLLPAVILADTAYKELVICTAGTSNCSRYQTDINLSLVFQLNENDQIESYFTQFPACNLIKIVINDDITIDFNKIGGQLSTQKLVFYSSVNLKTKIQLKMIKSNVNHITIFNNTDLYLDSHEETINLLSIRVYECGCLISALKKSTFFVENAIFVLPNFNPNNRTIYISEFYLDINKQQFNFFENIDAAFQTLEIWHNVDKSMLKLDKIYKNKKKTSCNIQDFSQKYSNKIKYNKNTKTRKSEKTKAVSLKRNNNNLEKLKIENRNVNYKASDFQYNGNKLSKHYCASGNKENKSKDKSELVQIDNENEYEYDEIDITLIYIPNRIDKIEVQRNLDFRFNLQYTVHITFLNFVSVPYTLPNICFHKINDLQNFYFNFGEGVVFFVRIKKFIKELYYDNNYDFYYIYQNLITSNIRFLFSKQIKETRRNCLSLYVSSETIQSEIIKLIPRILEPSSTQISFVFKESMEKLVLGSLPFREMMFEQEIMGAFDLYVNLYVPPGFFFGTLKVTHLILYILDGFQSYADSVELVFFAKLYGNVLVKELDITSTEYDSYNGVSALALSKNISISSVCEIHYYGNHWVIKTSNSPDVDLYINPNNIFSDRLIFNLHYSDNVYTFLRLNDAKVQNSLRGLDFRLTYPENVSRSFKNIIRCDNSWQDNLLSNPVVTVEGLPARDRVSFEHKTMPSNMVLHDISQGLKYNNRGILGFHINISNNSGNIINPIERSKNPNKGSESMKLTKMAILTILLCSFLVIITLIFTLFFSINARKRRNQGQIQSDHYMMITRSSQI